MKNFAKLTRRRVIPEAFIRSPVSMKKGMASREKPEMPFIMLWGIRVSGALPVTKRYSTADMPIDTKMFVPKNMRRNMLTKISNTFI